MVMCWAPNCKHYNVRETCKFFVFPKDAKEYKRWIKLLRRDEKPGPGARVCSCHFRDGKRENGPELFVHNVEKLFKPHHLSPESKKRKRELQTLATSELPEMGASTSSYEPEIDIEAGTSDAGETQPEVPVTETLELDVRNLPSTSQSVQHLTEHSLLSPAALEAENYLLTQKLQEKQALLETAISRFSYDRIKQNDKLVLLYTGLPTSEIFATLCDLIKSCEIKYYLKWKVVSLSINDQLLLTLMKLRHNFPHDDLAVRFGISQATVTNIIITFIHVIYETLYEQIMKSIPSRNKNKSCLPSCFSTFTNCRAILDCTEIACAVPRQSLKTQRATYSTYKHRNTWKGLVAVAPNGVITFVSSLYPGSTSDKKIVEICGILEQFEPGDLILADKGFLIKDLLPAGVSLNIPPFLTTPQFTPEQIQRTQAIAKARIHVERAIGRMKVYKILEYIPQPLFPYASTIFKTIAALTNLQYPLIKEVGQFYCEDT